SVATCTQAVAGMKLNDADAIGRLIDDALQGPFASKALRLAATTSAPICLEAYENPRPLVGGYGCEAKASQVWSLSRDGKIRNGSLCLDVENQGEIENTRVLMKACNESVTTWRVDPRRRLVANTGMCIHVSPAATPTAQTLAVMRTCSTSDEGQAFDLVDR